MRANQTIKIIIAETCDYFRQDQKQVLSRCRKRELVTPKHFAMYFAKKHCKDISLEKIGEMFGHYDHCSVLHAVNHIKDLIDVNGYGKSAEELNARIKQRLSIHKKPNFRLRRNGFHHRAMARKSRQLFKIFQLEHSMGSL